MKHMQYFLDSADDTSITAKYRDFLMLQSSAVCHNALDATDDVGSVWYAPDNGGSQWGPQASASGLEAVISASKVCLVTLSTGSTRMTYAILVWNPAYLSNVAYPITRSYHQNKKNIHSLEKSRHPEKQESKQKRKR